MGDVNLVITRTFNAKPEDVFQAWLDQKQVAEWYGPEGTVNDIEEYDAREGGAYRLTMNMPDGSAHPLRGKFVKIEKPNKLVLTWQWENPQGVPNMGDETTVTVEFKAAGEKTEMTMTHAGFASEKGKEMHNQGWSSSFNKLERVLA